MKKIVVIGIVFLSLYLLNYSNAYSQCPPNWNHTIITYGPDQYGCKYEVEFCYKCGLTGADPLNVKVLNIKPIGGCFAPDKDWLVNEISKSYSQFCTVPPCEEGCREFIMEFPLCMQWHTYGSIYEGEYHYISWLEACPGSGYCQMTYKMCYDPNLGFNIICPNDPLVTYQTFNLNCPDIQLEPIIENDFEGERITSECFKYYYCR